MIGGYSIGLLPPNALNDHYAATKVPTTVIGSVKPAVSVLTADECSRPVAGIDERLLFGGSLAYEKAHYW
jgi:hypothetical protein